MQFFEKMHEVAQICINNISGTFAVNRDTFMMFFCCFCTFYTTFSLKITIEATKKASSKYQRKPNNKPGLDFSMIFRVFDFLDVNQ